MAQTVLITLTIAGADTGPFDLFSDADGYAAPFTTGVSKAALMAGYVAVSVPDAATTIKVVSKGTCTNAIFLPIIGTSATTTTTSSTSSSSTSSTSTSTSTSTSSTSTTSRLRCVAAVYFNVTVRGLVRYSRCCGGEVVEMEVEVGYQVINDCLIFNSLAPAPMGGASISEITYDATSCTC